MCFLQDIIEYMTVCVCVCEFNEKIISQSVLEPEFLLSIYNINTDQSKDDYHLETSGDYVLNTLLVICIDGLEHARELELYLLIQLI